MSNESIPKSLLYCELVVGKLNVYRSRLLYKDVFKRDLKSLGVDMDEWDKLIDDRNKSRTLIRKSMHERENYYF